ncbi:hypothetical protein NMG60_11025824 [Bertholletia excelsa]
MGDFSFPSDSSDESAVEELLSQAMDQSILEQVAAINCSGFGSDSVLPSHLEARFRKLKSFPASNPKHSSSAKFNTQLPSVKSFNPQIDNSDKGKSGSNSPSDDENVLPNKASKEKLGLKLKLGSGSGSSPSKSPKTSAGDEIFSPLKENPDAKLDLKSKSRSGLYLSPSNSSNLSDESPSSPKKTGCFWCSPKKTSRRKSKENSVDWGRNGDEFLSDLKIFSAKEQQKILKKAMKEEEKINREAEKIVKWAKQASARMNIPDIEAELSDSEKPK